MKRIAVVGGGPGGLFTTLLLGQKCAERPHVTLFEASARLGGKVLTRRFDAAPVPYEAVAGSMTRMPFHLPERNRSEKQAAMARM